MNFCGLATQAPMRGLPRTSGRDSELELLEPGQALGRNGFAGDVGDDFRQVADLAGLVQNAGLFLALWPVTQKFHACSPVVR